MDRAQYFAAIEQSILDGKASEVFWDGIEIRWRYCPLKRGGTLKRKGQHGNLIYAYRGKEITRVEALKEILTPAVLRQAIIEAESVIECTMCGLVVVGEAALEPYRSIRFRNGSVIAQKPWGLVFRRMDGDKSVELRLCPDCLDRIEQGEFRES